MDESAMSNAIGNEGKQQKERRQESGVSSDF
jgi:hypothetical protein